MVSKNLGKLISALHVNVNFVLIWMNIEILHEIHFSAVFFVVFFTFNKESHLFEIHKIYNN